LHSRKQQSDEDSDNRDDNEQLDERKTTVFFGHLYRLLGKQKKSSQPTAKTTAKYTQMQSNCKKGVFAFDGSQKI
jgi:hypothetical protein